MFERTALDRPISGCVSQRPTTWHMAYKGCCSKKNKNKFSYDMMQVVRCISYNSMTHVYNDLLNRKEKDVSHSMVPFCIIASRVYKIQILTS